MLKIQSTYHLTKKYTSKELLKQPLKLQSLVLKKNMNSYGSFKENYKISSLQIDACSI